MQRQILQEPILDLGGELVKPFIIGDSAYPLLMNMQKLLHNVVAMTSTKMHMTRHFVGVV